MSEKSICKNCGKCCGPVPIIPFERKRIEAFLEKHPHIAKQARSKPFSLSCVFRDDEKKRCMIYSCRPSICRVYTCSSFDWQKKYKFLPNQGGEIHLINEVFGSPLLTNMYADHRKSIFGEI